jgi:hypothetical protein
MMSRLFNAPNVSIGFTDHAPDSLSVQTHADSHVSDAKERIHFICQIAFFPINPDVQMQSQN